MEEELGMLILESVAKGAGEEIVKELVFGDNTAEELANIEAELHAINIKLDHLTSLVEHLPEVILDQSRHEAVDESYRQIKAGVDVEVDHDIAYHMWEAWLTIIDLEDRPQTLLMLPYWAEVLRANASGEIPGFMAKLRTTLQQKIQALNAVIQSCVTNIDLASATADPVLKSQYVIAANSKIQPDEPFLIWKPAADRTIVTLEMDSAGPHQTTMRRVYTPDHAFNDARNNASAQLAQLRNAITAQANKLRATTPPTKVLEFYEQSLPH